MLYSRMIPKLLYLLILWISGIWSRAKKPLQHFKLSTFRSSHFNLIRRQSHHTETSSILYSSVYSDLPTPSTGDSNGFKQSSERRLKTLLIDNYDSYTYNLWQLLTVVNGGVAPTVIYNDQYATWQIANQELPEYDNIVLSPGPGSPLNREDFGLSSDAILNSEKPILGICLGHQGIGSSFGGLVRRAPVPMHGRLSRIEHDGSGLFSGIPQNISVVRYHSLIVDEKLPSNLVPTAWALPSDEKESMLGKGAGRILMGLKHLHKPIFGVQFHPESISTEYGFKILQNFNQLTHRHLEVKGIMQSQLKLESIKSSVESITQNRDAGPQQTTDNVIAAKQDYNSSERKRNIHIMKRSFGSTFSLEDNIEKIFENLFGASTGSIANPSSRLNRPAGSFWLDSTMAINISQIPTGSYSYFGSLETVQDYSVEYLGNNELIIRSNWDPESTQTKQNIEIKSQNIFAYLEERLLAEKLTISSQINYEGFLDADNTSAIVPQLTHADALFGYIGYEARMEASHITTTPNKDQLPHGMFNLSATYVEDFMSSTRIKELGYPLATLLCPSRYIIWDHDRNQLYIVATTTSSSENVSRVRAKELGQELSIKLESIISTLENQTTSSEEAITAKPSWKTRNLLVADKSRQEYITNIENCFGNITAGESYEVCLTLQFKGPFADEIPLNKCFHNTGEAVINSPPRRSTIFDAYKKLRKFNGAPYSSFFQYDPLGDQGQLSTQQPNPSLRLPWYQDGGFSILCSSPERYLKIDEHGIVESKPIKGTARRDVANPLKDVHIAAQLKADEKSQAENLMIVDLVRNDLGRVCAPGSVHVPSLMHIESYASVHQLVSTIRGRLAESSSSVHAIVATFPGGSMTGAPKLRTMNIIDDLEGRARGVYSGAIGYFGMKGLLDLNIVIRTAVISGGNITIASGGAIVAMSDPFEEVDEVFLKARTVSQALAYDVTFKP